MTLSLYDATIPAFLQILVPVGGLVEKARAHSAAGGVSQEALCDARLAPDMWPFAKQVACACQHSAGAVAGVQLGETGPDLTAPPMTFDGLAGRVAEAVASLQAVTPEVINALADSDHVFRIGDRKLEFSGQDYLLGFAMPNFYFHASMAYAVLRNAGVAIGKMDFLGAVPMKK